MPGLARIEKVIEAPWQSAARRARRLARGALRRAEGLVGRATGLQRVTRPPAMTAPQAKLTGIRRYIEHRRAGRSRPHAAVAACRDCLAGGNVAGALRLGHSLLRRPSRAELGHAVLGITYLDTGGATPAWQEFSQLRDPRVIAAAGTDYFPLAFDRDPAAAAGVATDLLDRLARPDLTGELALTIAHAALTAGDEALADQVWSRAREGRFGPYLPLQQGFERLAEWFNEGLLRQPPPDHAATLRFGVLEHRQPWHRSSNLGDYLQSLAGLGLLVRHRGLRFVGDPGLAGLADQFAGTVKPGREVEGAGAVVQLVEVQREASSWQRLADPTWAILGGWFGHRTPGGRYALEFHPALRPILLSFHLAEPTALSREAVAWLRRYGPVGCRDWATVALLHAAGVPAFFSGCLTSTVDTVFPDSPRPARARIALDPHDLIRIDDKGDVTTADGRDLTGEPLAANLRRAGDWVDRYHTVYAEVVTSRLHSYLPARAIGSRVRFEPANPSDPWHIGLLELDDVQFEAMRQGLLERTAEVFGLLLAGAGEDEVYRRWRELCAADVAEAERFLAGFSLVEHPLPQPSVPAPPATRLVVVDAPVRSEKGVARLLETLREHAPEVPVVVVGPGGRHAEGVRWVADLPVPERGSAQQQQALLVASVLGALPDGVRALLLPSDAVVRGPLDALFAIDLAGAALAAREELRRGRDDLSTLLRRIAARQANGWREALALLAAGHAHCGHGSATFDPRVAVLDTTALAASGFTALSRNLIEDYGASLGEALNLVLRGRHARLAACDHATAALETPPAGATVISGLSQARMGAHWFD